MRAVRCGLVIGSAALLMGGAAHAQDGAAAPARPEAERTSRFIDPEDGPRRPRSSSSTAATTCPRTDRRDEVLRQNVGGGGFGFRYELARKFGPDAGIDVAHSPGTTAVYIFVGSAWLRP